ncbi:MAG: PQQ-binding-like beta-propeller repeat protein [Verrucomicrobiales bacterium]
MFFAAAALGGLLVPPRACVAEAVAPSAEKFEQQSLALRTALFYDPSLDLPLKGLIELYGNANRADELIGLYRTHAAQYPEDAGSQAVLVRLLLELKRPEASSLAQAAVEGHPANALLLYLRHLDLDAQRDSRSLDFLSQAVDKEADPTRKRAWVDKLVTAAVGEGRRDLAEKHLRALATMAGQGAEALVTLAHRMAKERFHALALETLGSASKAGAAPETAVEIELQAAAAEAALDRTAEAAKRLDALLAKVASDYSRRPEIVQRRVLLLETNADRERMLKTARAAYAANPRSEASALDLAELLAACELRLEAVRVLIEAAKNLPQSERLEKATLSLLDRLGDERGVRDFLESRLAHPPERLDLAYRLIKALYALGARDEAARRFSALLDKTDAADRITRQLDLGRSLRRMNLPADAASIFRAVVTAEPGRLDVRRELAETLIAAGDKPAARRLMRQALTESAEIENFLDVIGFMTQQDLLPEARDALQQRIAREPRQFELPLLLVDVLTKLGEQKESEAQLEIVRPLADTEARYRRWLEAASAFHEAFETSERFFDGEQARLAAEVGDEKGGGWTKERAARYLAFCEVTRHNKTESRLAEILQERLKDTALPPDLRTTLHRLLVETLGRDPKNAIEVRNHLQWLAEEDTARADEYRLRLAKAQHEALQKGGGRSDQIRALLQVVEVSKIREPALLRGTHKLFFDYAFPDKALAVLEQLTALEPADRGHWERWLSALAGLSDEKRLRDALRALLAGVAREPLSDETLDLLRSHFIDSCWRSIASIMATGEADRLSEILPFLDTIERTKKLDAERLWVTWTRGWVLRQLGHDEAAEEAASRIESIASALPRPGDAEQSEPPGLLFPDGLSLSLPRARAMLKERSQRPAFSSEQAAGPASPPEMRWGFETDTGAIVVQLIPFGPSKLFVVDNAATLYQLDTTNGKLLWREHGLWKARSGPGPSDMPIRASRRAAQVNYGTGYYGDPAQNLVVPPRFACDPENGRLFLCRDGILTARSAQDGRVLWQSEIAGEIKRVAPQPGQPAPLPIPDEIFLDLNGRVIVWRAETASAAAFHPATGKLLWSRVLAAEKPNPQLNPLNSGASCADGLLLVYGHLPAVLDTSDGATLWSFDASAAKEFPLTLKTHDEKPATPGSANQPAVTSLSGSYAPQNYRGSGAAGGMPPRRLAMNHLKPLAERAAVLSQWIENKGVLVAPAVSWAEQGWQPIGGVIANGRLILTMPQLTQVLSLDLPLAGARFSLNGSFVGVTGNKAVFQLAGALALLDMARGTTTPVPLDVLGTGGQNAVPEVCLAGTRLYIAGEKGLLCVNPHTQRVLYFAPWPEPVTKFAGHSANTSKGAAIPADPFAQGDQMAGRAVQWHPRFIVQPSTPPTSIALFPRSVAHDGVLYAVVAPNKVVALADVVHR